MDRILHIAPGRRDTTARQDFWRAFLTCGLAALCILLPFVLVDGGFFHYAGDFNSQQITFYRYVNQLVKQGASYAWAADLGSDVVNAFSFYLLGSPFFWLSLLLTASWLPYCMAPLLVLKFAVAGGGAMLYLRRYVKSRNLALVGACLYALSGFSHTGAGTASRRRPPRQISAPEAGPCSRAASWRAAAATARKRASPEGKRKRH